MGLQPAASRRGFTPCGEALSGCSPFRICINREVWVRMEEQAVRKTYKEKVRPTPAQERALEEVLWRCRDLYNAALEQRITAYQRRRVSLSRYEQEAELKEIRAEFPKYSALHSHVPQDVLARLEKTYQAFFRRLQRGEK